MLKKLKKYIENPKFTPENVEKVSKVSTSSYSHFLEEKITDRVDCYLDFLKVLNFFSLVGYAMLRDSRLRRSLSRCATSCFEARFAHFL